VEDAASVYGYTDTLQSKVRERVSRPWAKAVAVVLTAAEQAAVKANQEYGVVGGRA